MENYSGWDLTAPQQNFRGTTKQREDALEHIQAGRKAPIALSGLSFRKLLRTPFQVK